MIQAVLDGPRIGTTFSGSIDGEHQPLELVFESEEPEPLVQGELVRRHGREDWESPIFAVNMTEDAMATCLGEIGAALQVFMSEEGGALCEPVEYTMVLSDFTRLHAAVSTPDPMFG